MKKNALLLIILFFFCNINCQNFTGCIEINFEEIPNQAVQEGLSINNQYLASHGIRFQLENGASPILAQVGGTATAFGSVYGNDQPEPGSGIGEFFLTDNGVLSGLQMIPVIVSFEMPIDSFSACVLDIDFDEFFIIQARGQNGENILVDTITSGDPGTGDGVSSCWGFNFDGCEGSIYSIRFEGHRMQAGAFGLGMDNFSFCFAGIDIANEIAVDIQDLNCEEPTGSVSMINLGASDYLYSLDGINYQNDPFFDGLGVGGYTVFVQDMTGCEAEFEIEINDFEPLVIIDTILSHTNCGDDDGSIQIFTSYTEGVIYSIDGVNFQESPVFSQLAAANYPVTILDGNACFYNTELTINPSSAPVINHVSVINDYCNDHLGSLAIQADGGVGDLVYMVNDFPPSTMTLFDSLATGNYFVQVSDELGCLASEEVAIAGGPLLLIENIQTIAPDCDEQNGEISFQATGGTGQLVFLLNGQQVQFTSHYTNLSPDDYLLTVVDAVGCEQSTSLNLPLPICPVFIPNVFSPNFDGTNDRFKIFTNSNYDIDVLKYQIFDRWGELVWEDSEFTILTARKNWWDGSFRNQPASQGVYVYVIEVEHNNGLREVFSGDVTLIR